MRVNRARFIHDRMILHSEMICFALYSTAQAMQNTYSNLLADLDLTYPQYLVILVLWESEASMTVGSLGDALHLESNTLTPLLKRLEKAEFVTRRRVHTDERRVSVELTAKGRALRERAMKIPDCVKTQTGLNKQELAELTHQLTQLSQKLRSPRK